MHVQLRHTYEWLLLMVCCCSCTVSQEKVDHAVDITLRTKVVLLGTGTPNADPDRFGPSVAIVVDKTPYIIDCGPGLVRSGKVFPALLLKT